MGWSVVKSNRKGEGVVKYSTRVRQWVQWGRVVRDTKGVKWRGGRGEWAIVKSSGED